MEELRVNSSKIRSKANPICWIVFAISSTTFATSYLPSAPMEWLENRATAAVPAPRIVLLSGEPLGAVEWNARPIWRPLHLFPADPTDATQIYGEMDSEDSPVMEKQDQNCSPTKHKIYPTCNNVHMMDFLFDFHMNKTSVLSTKGYWRTAWTHSETLNDNSTQVVFKTMRTNHNFEEAYYDFQQLDALVMERLTSSPYVIDIYSFCGLSVLTDFAGKDISYVVDHTPRKDRLQLAKQVAHGVADLHKAGIVHNDLNPANLAFSEKKNLPVLFDFNIAVIRNNHCPFVARYPNPQWRAPEEQTLGTQLDEKVDIYALGNVFFRFAVGESPWRGHGLRLTTEEKESIAAKKLNGTSVPPYELPQRRRDPSTLALLEITKQCFAYNQSERPSAHHVLSLLRTAIHNVTGQGKLISSKRNMTIPALQQTAKSHNATVGLVSEPIDRKAPGNPNKTGHLRGHAKGPARP